MRDSHSRVIDYARVSITDRCNLRCVYCMPGDGVALRDHADILSYEDIVRVCRAFAAAGVRKLKITGGEPLVRRGVAELAAMLKELRGIESVTLTTNGVLLPPLAGAVRDAGIDGVNISLDAVDPDRYRELTRGGDVALALAGIDAALDAGLPVVKVNCVPFAGGNERELVRVAELARERPLHVRFIEMMPLGTATAFVPVRGVDVFAALRRAFGEPEAAAGPSGTGPARYYAFPGFRGAIGFIDTLNHDICGGCNRLRLTADGVLKACLHMDGGVSLKPALACADDDALQREIAAAVLRKPPHHEFAVRDAAASERRGMSEIGG